MRHASKNFSFEYQTLGPASIRLLRFIPTCTSSDIQCELEHHDDVFEPNHTIGYTALSYVWGDSHTKRSINLNGHLIPVTTNLWEALRAIWLDERESDILRAPLLYWIDALCINQDDVVERNHQVSQMWRIYSAANKVIAWLGIERMGTSVAFEYLNGLNPAIEAPELPDELLELVWENPYFRRTWIISEYIQAACLVVMCGKYKADGEKFNFVSCALPWVLENRKHHLNALPGHSEVNITAANQTINEFEDLLCVYQASNCADRRDRIFAMLGHPRFRLIPSAIELKPDYNLDCYELTFVVMEFASELCRDQGEFKNFVHWAIILTMLGDEKLLDYRALLISKLHRWSGPDMLLMKCGKLISCSDITMRNFIVYLFTGRRESTLEFLFDELSCATAEISEDSLFDSDNDALRLEWPNVEARWIREQKAEGQNEVHGERMLQVY